MQNAAVRACLMLHRLPQLSSKDLSLLLQGTGCPQRCFSLSQVEMAALGLSQQAQQALQHNQSQINQDRIEKDCECLQSLAIKLISINCSSYPALLKEIPDPPPLLYVRGNTALLERPQIAMVGSRKSSAQGRDNAYHFAKELATGGFTVTSGLALGIDGAAHRGALDAKGDTIAVLGTGVDRIYPASHSALFKQLLGGGALLSEFPLGTSPRPAHFPVRNRIISGLSLGVVIVEAALKSGSLITARCALEQNREVFALPGSIHSPAYRGCHQLIRSGAQLVETAADIMEALAHWYKPSRRGVIQQANTQPKLEVHERMVIDAMGFDPVSIDGLQQRCGLPLSTLLANLTTLELKGLLENQGGRYQRISGFIGRR